jgi:hypothetical protein
MSRVGWLALSDWVLIDRPIVSPAWDIAPYALYTGSREKIGPVNKAFDWPIARLLGHSAVCDWPVNGITVRGDAPLLQRLFEKSGIQPGEARIGKLLGNSRMPNTRYDTDLTDAA